MFVEEHLRHAACIHYPIGKQNKILMGIGQRKSLLADAAWFDVHFHFVAIAASVNILHFCNKKKHILLGNIHEKNNK